jgi:hypothetical protein
VPSVYPIVPEKVAARSLDCRQRPRRSAASTISYRANTIRVLHPFKRARTADAIVTSVIRSDLVDAIGNRGHAEAMNSSLSPPSPGRHVDTLLILLSFALILAGLLTSL